MAKLTHGKKKKIANYAQASLGEAQVFIENSQEILEKEEGSSDNDCAYYVISNYAGINCKGCSSGI